MSDQSVISPAPAPAAAATPAAAPAPAAPNQGEFREIVFPQIEFPADKSGEQAKPADAGAPAPAPAPVDDQTGDIDPDGESDPPKDGQPRDSKGRFKQSAQERIDELTRARREAEREADYWRNRAATPPAPAPTPDPKPKRDDFQTDLEYIDALTDWKVQQAMTKVADQTSTQVEAVSQAQVWNDRVKSTRAEITDYDSVMSQANTPVAPHVAQLLLNHDRGPALAYHLAKNPDLLMSINEMDLGRAAMEVGAFAASVLKAPTTSKAIPPVPAPATAPAAPAPSKTTNAPDPIQTPSIGAGNPKTDPSQMSMEEYKAWRKNQGAWWAN